MSYLQRNRLARDLGAYRSRQGLGAWGPTSPSSFTYEYAGGGRYTFDPPVGEAFTYTGPLYPQVHDNGDGTRTIYYNPDQAATCAVKPTADPEVPLTPGMAPKASAGAPEGWYVLAEAQGKKVQEPLSAGGIIMGPSDIVMLPVDCRPNEHPTINFGESSTPQFDPYDYCSPQGPTWTGVALGVYDPLTGARLSDLYEAPSGCDSPSGYVLADGTKVPKCDAPFTGKAAFFGNGVQGPSPGDPTYGMVGVDPCALAPGTGGYEKGSLFAPYAPWLDPSSSWYGHPVLAEGLNWEVISTGGTGPAQPLPGPYDPPCRPGDDREMIDGVVRCIPVDGVDGPMPADAPPCWVGVSTTPPFGDVFDPVCLGIAPDPEAPGAGNGDGGPVTEDGTPTNGGGYQPGGNGTGNGDGGGGGGGGFGDGLRNLALPAVGALLIFLAARRQRGGA